MINKLKPYYVILVHEDRADADGTPTEIVEYAWTHKSAEKLRDEIWKSHGLGKWMMVFPANWMWWWTMNAGTVYAHVRYDRENDVFISTRIAWWRKERLWTALWRLVFRRGKHSRGAHRAAEPKN